MTPVVAQTYTQPAPPVAQSAVADIAVRSVSGATIAANAVASNSAAKTVVNNRQNQTPIAEKTRTTQDVATLTSRANPNAVSESSTTNQPFNPFLAQLLAQTDPASTTAVAQSFTSGETSRTILDREVINDFSYVRYGPSFAAKPQPELPRIDIVLPEAPAEVQTVSEPEAPVAEDIPPQPETSESPSVVARFVANNYAPEPESGGSLTLFS